MSGISSNLGCESWLEARLNNVWPTSKDLTLKLFCNDVTPLATHTAASYTEASGGGYAAKTLTCGSWTVTDGSATPQATYSIQTFTFTGEMDTNPSAYGYYIVDGDGVLQHAERFDYVFTPVANGNYVSVTPVIKLNSAV